MYCKCLSGAVTGIEGVLVSVEADVRNGLPAFSVVGGVLGDMKDSKERVRIAVENSGFMLTPKHITVNMYPVEVRKEGTSFDLPIAISILAAFGYVPTKRLNEYLITGELSLDGKIRKVKNLFPLIFVAKKNNLKIICPEDNLRSLNWTDGVGVIGVSDLNRVIDILSGEDCESTAYSGNKCSNEICSDENSLHENCLYENKSNDTQAGIFDGIFGNSDAKQACLIAAAGGHNIFMAGKSLKTKRKLSEALQMLYPDLEYEEIAETQKIRSVTHEKADFDKRPYLKTIAGDVQILPQDIYTAHNGIVFFEDITCFKGNEISLINEITENKKVKIKNGENMSFIPCNVKMMFSGTLCKCGEYPGNSCTCQKKNKGILKSGINDTFINNSDIFVCVYEPKVTDMTNDKYNDDSLCLRAVLNARKMQLKRYGDIKKLNAYLSDRETLKYCKNDIADTYLKEKLLNSEYGADEYFKILRSARTIADTEKENDVLMRHIDTALKFSWRNLI